MEIIYENNKRYVNLNDVGIFLEYKRVSVFISNICKKAKFILKDIFIEVEDLLKIIRKNNKEKISELFDILLSNNEQEEIDELIEEFNEKTNNEYKWIGNNKDNLKILKNLWYIYSSYNIKLINSRQLEKYITLYKVSKKEIYDLFAIYMQIMPYEEE